MKKIIFTIVFLSACQFSFAQVGVGTSTPETSFHVVGANASGAGNTPGALTAVDGITVPVVTDDMTSTSTNGTKTSQLVYSTNASSTGYYNWNGSAWVALTPAAGANSLGIDAVGGVFTGEVNATDYSAVTENFIIARASTGPGTLEITLPDPTINGNRLIIVSTSGKALSFSNDDNTTTLANGTTGMLISNGTTWIVVRGN